jgi:hypothetical protein
MVQRCDPGKPDRPRYSRWVEGAVRTPHAAGSPHTASAAPAPSCFLAPLTPAQWRCVGVGQEGGGVRCKKGVSRIPATPPGVSDRVWPNANRPGAQGATS